MFHIKVTQYGFIMLVQNGSEQKDVACSDTAITHTNTCVLSIWEQGTTLATV